MTNKANQTAILIFSRTAAQEAEVKTFSRACGRSGNALIARHLIRRSLRTVRKSGYPYVLHFDLGSADSSFGERFADAIEGIFDKGYSRVIAIGNDSPELDADMLRFAGQQLEQKPIVLGPALDGGVYLIGLRKESYIRKAFIELPWQTADLNQAFLLNLDFEAEEQCWLPFLADIDNSKDFERLLWTLPTSEFLRTLRAIVASVRFPLSAPGFRRHVLGCYDRSNPFRGPPLRAPVSI